MTAITHTRRRGRRPGGRRAWANAVVLVFCALWVFPVYWMLNTSFKPETAILTPTPVFFPVPFTISNYIDAFTKSGFLSSLANSILIAICVVIITIVLGFLAGAALTKYAFRGRSAIIVVILTVQMVPGSALLIPMFLSLKSVGLLNSYAGLILAYTATVLPFSIVVLRGFFQGIPVEIEEAARLDGASEYSILTKIYFPLVLPGLIATSVFAFIAAWNDYIVAYVMMRDQVRYTLPVWLVSFSSNVGTDYGGLVAGSVIFAIPVVVFFLIVQRNLVSGLSAGAVKG